MPRLVVAAWMGGLAAVIALAVLGGEPAAVQGPAVIADRPPTATPNPWPTDRAAVVSRPSVEPGLRATLRQFAVRGRVARDAGEVWIVLATDAGIAVSTARLDPTGHGHAGWVPFESWLGVYRSAATMGDPLYVTTVGPSGVRSGNAPHRYNGSLFLVVGPDGQATLVAGPAPSPTGSGSHGNDGLVGGIVFGIPMAERDGP